MELSKVKGITQNSKEVQEGWVFVAIKGSSTDGHNFVQEALSRGASLVFVEKDVGVKDERIIKVEDTRKLLGELANEFFGRPSERLKIVGITGTNGKTTSSHLVESVLNAGGIPTGLIGTIYYRFKDKIYEYEGRTTPDPIQWHRTLKQMLEDGAEAVACEVSSHALDQRRVWGTKFFITAFTNLSQDHLDYHGSMENYFRAKLRLFVEYPQEYSLINIDNKYGRRILKELKGKAITYGREGSLKIIDFETSIEGSKLTLEWEGRTYKFFSNLRGEFQAYNLSLGILVGFLFGLDAETVQQGVGRVIVPGRFETFFKEGKLAIVDYAHTPDALEKVLITARRLTKGKLWVVFGAGGNRDKTKRPLMGKVAEKWADFVVITSDNPRWEEPEAIIEDILKGIEQKQKVFVQKDRKEAIKFALQNAKEGDVVLIAGKGHEDYQEIKGVKYPFKDQDVVKEVLNV
ncbi:MAG: UDP-N-acetylmuramoyl-L-alanyl-D-glutamate--2,6-diaminopimelate ligase [Thermocrinis sp.]|uniref:UDP-N-acetylmuramoyl-L-alanyl-D-glutamate--2, 6-diaminopimelate ligase n=1 Tax=Thermocrinis sp. TaxID=2024383 RepID=UPI003C120104